MTDRSVDLVSSNTGDQVDGMTGVNIVLLGAGGDVELYFAPDMLYGSIFHLDMMPTLPTMDLSGWMAQSSSTEVIDPTIDSLIRLTLTNGT